MIKNKSSLTLTLTALFIGLVFLFTVSFQLYLPATRGFFNLGEGAIYLAALIGGPIVGAIAGGVGSMLADIFLGYTHYALGTLIIKGTEGLLVGLLAQKLSKSLLSKSKNSSMLLSGFIIAALSLTMIILGNKFYTGTAEIYLISFSFPYSSNLVSLELVSAIWLVMSLLLIIITINLIRNSPDHTALIIAMCIGGIQMVLGYFLYQQFILGVAALAEIPFNVLQMLIGITIANYIYRGYKQFAPKKYLNDEW